VLVLIPDHTRTMPLPLLFRLMVAVIGDAAQLDFMVALGTHPPLSHTQLFDLVGLSPEERQTRYGHIGLLNHTWNDKGILADLGVIEEAQVKEIAGDYWHDSLCGDVPVQLNNLSIGYDQVIIMGPTFPHEVVGFSGGNKYLFPGISGPNMINTTHWLGALIGIMGMIGVKDTPVRNLINLAASMMVVPVMACSVVVVKEGLAGMFIGDALSAFSAAADLSSQRHITHCEKPFKRVLSYAPAMYDELWTAAKAMYKMEPVVADGGELILYAPHLDKVSDVHGEHIYSVGYHVRDYFLEQWDRFKDVPLGVLAHSTHLKGAGTFQNGKEEPRIQVTLASQISQEDCERLNLGYMNPDEIDLEWWKNQTDDDMLYVPKAGEMLYRLKT
jgi:nickel-dependent lactate racemase